MLCTRLQLRKGKLLSNVHHAMKSHIRTSSNVDWGHVSAEVVAQTDEFTKDVVDMMHIGDPDFHNVSNGQPAHHKEHARHTRWCCIARELPSFERGLVIHVVFVLSPLLIYVVACVFICTGNWHPCALIRSNQHTPVETHNDISNQIVDAISVSIPSPPAYNKFNRIVLQISFLAASALLPGEIGLRGVGECRRILRG